MAVYDGSPVVATVILNAVEQLIEIERSYMVWVSPSDVCQISAGDNKHYMEYYSDDMVPLYVAEGITKLYAKSDVSATLRVWGWRS